MEQLQETKQTPNYSRVHMINIEGNDGTGKSTLIKTLAKRFNAYNFLVLNLDFPAYDTATGAVVRNYLNGSLYSKNPIEVDPIVGSLPYAINRLEVLPKYEAAVEMLLKFPDEFDTPIIILSNRSYLSNYFYQFSKYYFSHIPAKDNTEAYRTWEDMQLALEIYPTFLNNIDIRHIYNYYIAAESIETNLKKMQDSRESLDLHEQNTDYLKNVEEFALCIGQSDQYFTTAYYDYTTMPMTNGSTPEEITKELERVASEIVDKTFMMVDSWRLLAHARKNPMGLTDTGKQYGY